jgi:hypothetical protein
VVAKPKKANPTNQPKRKRFGKKQPQQPISSMVIKPDGKPQWVQEIIRKLDRDK